METHTHDLHGLTIRAELQLSTPEINDLRDRYFPEWRRHDLSGSVPRDARPFYSIFVETDDLRRSVLAAAPPGIDVAVSMTSRD